MIVDFLRSCHASAWRFYDDDPLIVTRGHFYFVPEGNPCLPFPHDFYSGTWMQGDPLEGSPTGPIAGEPRPWRDGYLDISFPPPVALGTEAEFSGVLAYPEDRNTDVLRAGIPEQCWIAAGFPFQAFDTVSDLKNCCVRTVYARLIELVYDAETATIDEFFLAWLRVATVTHYPEAGLDPAMTIVTTPEYAIVIVSGTTNFQQIATQATTGFLGPQDFGGVRTIPIWFDCATLIFDRLDALGVSNTASLLLTGHSYGGAACAIAALRTKLANPTQQVFLLTYGMPKPCDEGNMVILDTLNRIHVFNSGDIVPQIPLAIYQSEWFLGMISEQLKRRWGAWAASSEYLIQEIGGRKTLDHLPGLTGDVLQPLLTTIFLEHRIPTIQAHKITEYVLRSCLRCNCPRWPFDEDTWKILFSFQCGEKGFRFRAEVIDRTHGLEPRGRFRWRAVVLDRGPIPRKCYYLCLNAAALQYADNGTVAQLFNATTFTLMFWGRRAAANAVVTVNQMTGVFGDRVEILQYVDGQTYFILAASPSLTYGTVAGFNDTLFHHFAMVFDGSQIGNANRLKAYVDGAQVTLSFVGTIPASTGPNNGTFFMGTRFDGTYYQTGDTDDVAIFHYAMDPATILKIAQRLDDPSFNTPSMYIPFEEGEGGTAHDESGNGHDFTLHNGASWCSSVCLPRSAARFRFRADVEAFPPDDGIARGKYRWKGDVHDASPIGDRIPGKYKWHADVIAFPGPPEVVSAKFRFKQTLWVRSIQGSVNAIRFLSAFAQQAQWDSGLGGEVGGFTLQFWSKRYGEGNGGMFHMGGLGDPPTFAELAVIFSETEGIQMKISALVDGEVLTTVAVAPGAIGNGWHHYAGVFTVDVDLGHNTVQIYVDGLPVSTTITSAAALFEFNKGGLENLGINQDGLLTNGLMDNAMYSPAPLTANQIKIIAQCETDLADVGGQEIFRFENDIVNLMYNDNFGVWYDGFLNGPIHVDDVPPLLAD